MPHLAAILDLLRSARWVTRARLLRWGTAAAVVSLGLLAWDVARHTTLGVTDAAGEHIARDFINYWAGAKLAAAGEARRVYDIDYFLAFERSLVGPASEFKFYVYPPVAMLLAWPVAWFSFIPGLLVWTGAGVALCYGLLERWVGWRVAALATVGAPAAFLNLLDGQNGYFSASLLAGGLLLLERRALLAGVLFGALCYKPQLGVLLPVALAAGGHWRTIAAAAATVAALTLITLVLYGTDTWIAFFHQLAFQGHFMALGASLWHRMPTVFAALRLAGAGPAAAGAAQVVSTLLAAGAVALVWRACCASEIKYAALAVAVFLATPYAWDYDAVVLLFAAAWLAAAAQRDGILPWDRIVIVALVALPAVALPIAAFLDVQIGPVVLWLALAALLRRAGVLRYVLQRAAA